MASLPSDATQFPLPGDRLSSHESAVPDRLPPTHPGLDWSTRVDPDQMFHLIDSLLPMEACLYHQVLPLSLEGSRLNLGMVNLEDTSALEYVRRLVSYIHCSVVPRLIDTAVHQSMLSAYLGRQDRQQAQRQTPLSAPPTPLPNSTVSSSPIVPANPDFPAPPPITPPAFQPTTLPTLEVEATHLSSPIEVLATLAPKHLLQELLARVLVGGIGRLFFERQAQRGRILWSQNGVLQSALEDIPDFVFQGVINELKILTSLPLISVEKPRQVDIERLYQQTRLLLRFRVMPSPYGEEATLQVLRGAALKFHQQQQLSNLGRDALIIAQQLQRKLIEIRDRAKLDPTFVDSQLTELSALKQVMQTINQQLQDFPTATSVLETDETEETEGL